MGRREIDELIARGRQRNIELNEITIDANAYDALIIELKPAMRHDVNPLREPIWGLTYNGIKITKRKCTGCCQHG